MTKHIGLSQRPNALMLLLILLLAGWAYSSYAEEKTRRLTLCVLDSATGDPIPGAIVRSEEALSAQPTDLQGHCTLSFPITKKRVTLTTSYLGYKSDSRTISLSEVRGVLTIRLEEDATLIDEVVVQGDLRQTSILQQTMKIDPKTLERSSTLTLGQLLETVPGVSTISSGSTISKPVIQGMHSGRILLLNNGVRLDSQSWGSDHAPEIDHTGATNVEVVKGAESVRYGYGAIGGVVLFSQAELPYGSKNLRVSGTTDLGYDTNAHAYSGTGSLEMGWRSLGLRLHGLYRRGGDYSTAEYILNNTGYTNISLSALAGWSNGAITATLFSSLFYARNGIYYASRVSDIDQLLARFLAGRPDERSLRPFSYEVEPPFQQSQHFMLKGEVKWQVSEAHKLRLILSHQDNLRWEFDKRTKADWSRIPMQDLILSTERSDLSWVAQWGGPLALKTESGLSGTYQRNYNYPGTKQPAFIPNYAALTLGGYILQDATFFERLRCSIGMRYDFRAMDVSGYTSLSKYRYYSDFKVYSNFTASLALHYQISDEADLRGNIGWSWRPPDINELYATGLEHGTYWVVGNHQLTAEHGYKSVLGGRWHNQWLSVEPSLFYQHIDNYIYDAIGKGLERFHNHPSGKYPRFIYGQDDARLYGGDLTLSAMPLQGLTLTGKGEWIRGRNVTRSEWLPFMPSDRYGLSCSYGTSLGSDDQYHTSVSLSTIYVTKQKHFNPEKDLVPETPPAYTLLNGSAEFSMDLPGGREVKLMLIGDNILNTLYKEYTDRFRYYAHARGANFSLRTIVKF